MVQSISFVAPVKMSVDLNNGDRRQCFKRIEAAGAIDAKSLQRTSYANI